MFDRVKRLLPVVYQSHIVPAALQDLAEYLAVRRIVVRNEDTQLPRTSDPARIVLQSHHASTDLLARTDRMKHVEQLALVEWKLEDGRKARRKDVKTRCIRVARNRQDRRRCRIRRGTPKALRHLQVFPMRVDDGAVIGLFHTDLAY